MNITDLRDEIRSRGPLGDIEWCILGAVLSYMDKTLTSYASEFQLRTEGQGPHNRNRAVALLREAAGAVGGARSKTEDAYLEIVNPPHDPDALFVFYGNNFEMCNQIDEVVRAWAKKRVADQARKRAIASPKEAAP